MKLALKFFLYFLLLILFSCKNVQKEPVEIAIEKAIEDFDKKIYIIKLNTDQGNLRDNTLKIVRSIRRFKPRVIFLDISFLKKFGNESIYAKDLNEDYPTISLFRLTNKSTSPIDIHSKQLIGTKISGRKRFYARGSLIFQGIELPDVNFILRGQHVCTYFFGKNQDTQKIEYFLPQYEYSDTMMESCSLVVANEYLKPYGLEIGISQEKRRFYLFSFLENEFGPIKYLNSPGKADSLEMALKIDTLFNEYRIEEIEKKDVSDIPKDSVFILSNDSKFETDKGLISGSQIIANEIRMLINLTRIPKHLHNEIEKKVIDLDR